MRTQIIVYISCCVVLASGTSAFAALHTFNDFSSLTTDPELSGTLSDSGFEVVFSGDDGAVLTDPDNGSFNSLILGTNVPPDRTALLTLSFNLPVTEMVIEFDAMHSVQNDQITASAGAWTDFPATLSLSGQILSSTANVINPGGSGIDDDLLATLTFGTPVSSIVFTSYGAFTLDAFTANAIPEPGTVLLLGFGGLGLVRRRG
ncbi:MAG: PEP-CTERM sorting domain-containing protein [Planctomycetota bacterium]|jgi:hypothetical protein